MSDTLSKEMKDLQERVNRLSEHVKVEIDHIKSMQAYQQFVGDAIAESALDEVRLEAERSFKHYKVQVRGQTITPSDSFENHLIWAAWKWAKENPVQFGEI